MSQLPPAELGASDSSAPGAAVDDFQREVLDESRERPVLVDFWAPWCGPCRALGPVLDRLAAEADGRWRLAKVNTDEHPALMMQYGIQGIPAVKLFVDGAPIAEFTGALPEHLVRQWLGEHLPSPARQRLAEAEAAFGRGDYAAGREHFEAVLDIEDSGPTAEAARMGLARLVVFEDSERAETLVEEQHTPEAEAVRTVAALLRRAPGTLPDGAARDRYAAALGALQSGEVDTALDRFIDAIQQDRAYDDDGARKAVVAIFRLLGEDDPIVRQHRPRFNMSLY